MEYFFTYLKMFDKENEFGVKASAVCVLLLSECWNIASKPFFGGHGVGYTRRNCILSGTFGEKQKVSKFPEGFLMAFTFVHPLNSAS